MRLVQCMICNKEFIQITPSHLKKHNLTIKEYREQYPDASLVSPDKKDVWKEGNIPWNKGKPFMQGKNHPLYGKHPSETTRRKMSESRLQGIKEKRIVPWNKGLTKETSPEIRRIAEEIRGTRWSKKDREKQSMITTQKSIHRKHTDEEKEYIRQRIEEAQILHKRAALEQAEELKKGGHRVILLDIPGYPRPDLIAIKGDNIKVYAVEIESGYIPPWKLEKYDDISFYDDIIWVKIK